MAQKTTVQKLARNTLNCYSAYRFFLFRAAVELFNRPQRSPAGECPVGVHMHRNDSSILVDFSISLGPDCRTAQHLRENNLSICSNPLDWMMLYELAHVISLFQNDFRDFFCSIREDTSKNKPFRYIIDTMNGMVSMHNFPRDVGLDIYYPQFLSIMQKRYKRMIDYIKQSHTILFVCHRNKALDYFSSFLCEFYGLFNKKYVLVNMKHDSTMSEYEECKVDISSDFTFIEYIFNDVHPNGSDRANPDFWVGNSSAWKNCLSLFRRSDRFKVEA
jgi:hypothetical protein